jgi:hypothetical protein
MKLGKRRTAVDKAFDEGGPVEAMKTAKRLWDGAT